ncbi:single-stranded DNA-binding protein [Symbiobacterium thermophilum]|uniref:Single-stranded DNA-binding protein n=2 Tax=Symbiobacterium thermophilum TaxID=2734 RepID=Q67J49_SYMTH|nr:single-stranded DNA-binding protein [Symbiobacterium thermophilum]MBY6275926.1 single-stranded DNA-binding protein [Symbiobacterium thermophilum]OTA41890.1 MAG: single-stranded DNA-binding protein [Symbiobacterium thermophilum]BAD42301.1 single-strand DNA-binding protein [Symbiobacterium thermophilum IAM 14863]
MLNSVVLIGRLTKDPELRYTPSGKAVATLRLAVDRGTVNQQGERETDFIDIVVWEKQAETVANYLQKGRLVAVQGRLQIRQYTTQDGQKREKAEVVATTVRFLDSARDHSGGGGGFSGPRREDGMGSELTLGDDEDVPF